MDEVSLCPIKPEHVTKRFRVYVVFNIVNGLPYVGKESGPLNRRRSLHLSDVSQGSSRAFAVALRTFGPDGFRFIYVYQTDSESSAMNYERELISSLGTNFLKGCPGYNMNAGQSSKEETIPAPSPGPRRANIKRGTPVVADEMMVFPSIAEAARRLNVHSENVCSCVNGQRRTTGGHSFRFATPLEIRLNLSPDEIQPDCSPSSEAPAEEFKQRKVSGLRQAGHRPGRA